LWDPSYGCRPHVSPQVFGSVPSPAGSPNPVEGGDTVGFVSTDVPRALRVVVRARRTGWRVRVARGDRFGVFSPVVWVVVTILCGVLGVAGVPAAVAAIVGMLSAAFSDRVHPLVAAALALSTPFVAVAGFYWLVLWFVAAAETGARLVGFRRFRIRVAEPARIVVAGWLRWSVVRIGDLDRVFVRQRQLELTLVLCTGRRTVLCPARRVEPVELASWLGSVLEPFDVPVRHYLAVGPPPGEHAWPADKVAAFWDVPVEDVPGLADRCGVRAHEAGMYNAYDIESSVDQVREIAGPDE
jgi:hypothetical protein